MFNHIDRNIIKYIKIPDFRFVWALSITKTHLQLSTVQFILHIKIDDHYICIYIIIRKGCIIMY